ncbi:hypothetical protein D3C87_1524050 [compost metagenome]
MYFARIENGKVTGFKHDSGGDFIILDKYQIRFALLIIMGGGNSGAGGDNFLTGEQYLNIEILFMEFTLHTAFIRRDEAGYQIENGIVDNVVFTIGFIQQILMRTLFAAQELQERGW